jgi:teichuronic acid biosynthesis glycosyltransferase TuaC
MTEARLRVLSFSTLFPNRARPTHGVFVKNRLERVAQHCDVDVVAPVGAWPDASLLWRVPQRDIMGRLRVWHPRFAVLPGLLKQYDATLLYRATLPQICPSLDPRGYDVVDAHYAYPDGVAAQRLANRLGKPFVITVRGSDLHTVARSPERGRLVAAMLRGANGVIAVSRALGAEAIRLGATPAITVVIPNGVDTARFYPRDREEARRSLGWPVDAIVLLSVGRLVPPKGFGLLIRAVGALRERLGRAIRCVILGEGYLRGALEREVRRLDLTGDVMLPGVVPQADLPTWYGAANLFCLFSQNEGCPNVLLEALACGTPAVAAGVGGIPEIINEGTNGLLLRERSEDAAVRALKLALERPWSREAVSRSRAVRDWVETAGAHVEVLRRAAGRT